MFHATFYRSTLRCEGGRDKIKKGGRGQNKRGGEFLKILINVVGGGGGEMHVNNETYTSNTKKQWYFKTQREQTINHKLHVI